MKMLPVAALLFLLPGFNYGQADPCKINVVSNTVTHVKRAEINFDPIGTEADNLFCTAFRTGSEFAVYFGLEVLNKTVCFSPGNRAMILFTDHTQGQVVNVQGQNCKGNFLVKGTLENGAFAAKDSVLTMLSQKKVRAIRFETEDGFLDYNVSEEDDRFSMKWAEDFMRGVRCLLNWNP